MNTTQTQSLTSTPTSHNSASYNQHGVNVPLMPSQAICVSRLNEQAMEHEVIGTLLQAPTGRGKTHIAAAHIASLINSEWFQLKVKGENILSPFKWLYVTRASAKFQTIDKLASFGLKGGLVASYNDICGKLGQIFIHSINIGNKTEYAWHFASCPPIIIIDEVQDLKNQTSSRTKKFSALFNHNSTRPYIMAMSATPFSNIEQGFFTYCLTQNKNKNNWTREFPYRWDTTKGRTHCSPHDMKNFMSMFGDKLVRMPRYNLKYKSTNHVVNVNFSSAEEQKAYKDAYQEYILTLRKILKDPNYNEYNYLTALLKFRQKAELLKAVHMARRIIKAYEQGYTPICMAVFTATLVKVAEHLIASNIFTKDDIAWIMGGNAEGKHVGCNKSYSPSARHKQQKAFQTGKRKVCLASSACGGTGLNLNHDSDLTNPRYTVCSLQYNDLEIVQMLGRVDRINSQSNSLQEVLVFSGTVEETDVKPIIEQKLSRLSCVCGSSKSWGHLFVPEDCQQVIEEEPLDLDSVVEDIPDDTQESVWTSNEVAIESQDNTATTTLEPLTIE